MLQPLISILIPCFNVERKVYRLFDSILQQTYNNFQLIVVNDGSTDNTEKIIIQYKKQFESIGIDFIYLTQKNLGVAKACELGLKYVKGEYLCWPDSDDFYLPQCIEKLLLFLVENPSYNLVRCNSDVYYEDNLNKSIGTLAGTSENRFNKSITDYIMENDVYFAPICYMMKFSAFKEVNKDLFLCNSKAGQNYQMILPLLYKSKCGYIDECLTCYIVFKKSHSHIVDYMPSYKKRVKRIENKCECVIETLQHMQMNPSDFSNYKRIAIQKMYAEKCLAAYDYGQKDLYKKLRPKVEDEYYINILKWTDTILQIPLSFCLHSIIVKLKQIIKKQSGLYSSIQIAKYRILEKK